MKNVAPEKTNPVLSNTNFYLYISEHGGALHKTFAATHELPTSDVINYEMPYSNEVVSDWLKAELRSDCSESSKGE